MNLEDGLIGEDYTGALEPEENVSYLWESVMLAGESSDYLVFVGHGQGRTRRFAVVFLKYPDGRPLSHRGH